MEINKYHRPLVAGIQVKSAENIDGELAYIDTATLAGVATRNLDGKKVLVTCRSTRT